jgi:probable phosphoglycerate mutase
MTTTVVLVRHGQTEWNRVERFRGRADIPLNTTGLQQAEAAARRIAQTWQPVAVYTSPLDRAVRTALAIGRTTGRVPVSHSGLTDIDYGEWQGLTPLEARQRWPELVEGWYATPALVRIPGGETLEMLRRRAMGAVQELTSRHTGETIVLVGHTVVNRIILLTVLGLGNDRFWRLRQEPCAINVFELDKGVFSLVLLNDTCHLAALTQPGIGSLDPPSGEVRPIPVV